MENPKPRTKEEKNSFKSCAKEEKSQKNSKPCADRGAEHQFVKNLKSRAKEEMNSFESLAKEKKSQKNSKSRAKNGQSINSKKITKK